MTPEVERVVIQHDLRRPVVHDDYQPALCACRTGTAEPAPPQVLAPTAYVPAGKPKPPAKWADVRAKKVPGLQDGGTCSACGGLTVRTGTCTTCTQCGETGGCG